MPVVRLHLSLAVAAFMLAIAQGRAGNVIPNMLLLDGTVLAQRIVVVGERGTILVSFDSGATWQAASVPERSTLTGISFAPDGRNGWAVGHDALILRTTDGGQTWRKQWQGANLTDSFLDVLAIDARHIIAVGAFGLFMTTVDGGETWLPRRLLEEDYHLNRLTRGPTGTLYLAGEHGSLLRSNDHGAEWTPILSPYDGSFYGILPLSDHKLIAYGLRGRIYFSNDDGDSWISITNDQRALLLTAASVPGGPLVLAGQARAYLAINESTMGLTPWSPNLQTAVAELLTLADGTLLALGEAGATLLAKP